MSILDFDRLEPGICVLSVSLSGAVGIDQIKLRRFRKITVIKVLTSFQDEYGREVKLTKGEAADELTRGLKAIKHAIEVIHQAMLTLDKPFYDAKTLGPDYRWDPTVTMNDGSDAILKSWRAIRGT